MSATFLQLVERARNADPLAIGLLIDGYGEVIQRELRFASLDQRIRRVVSQSDLVQSVWACFFLELLAGRVAFDAPEKMVAFLKLITQSKVVDVARFWTSRRRDVRRNRTLGKSEVEDTEAQIRPAESGVITAELLKLALNEMSADELTILKWRQEGVEWETIASRLGDGITAEAVRKKHERALERIARRLRTRAEGSP